MLADPNILLCLALAAVAFFVHRSASATQQRQQRWPAAFVAFQRQFLIIQALVFGADWLQGPYMYALYHSRGLTDGQIARLFLAGFGSSMLFGTIVGSLADRTGRRLNCMLFGAIYALSCATMHSHAYAVLLLGRLLGGIATSIMFTAFEAWLVSEHKRLRFSPDLLPLTFERITMLNGVMGIVAGVIAGGLAERWGPVAPFNASAAVLLAISAAVWALWGENYGAQVGATGSGLWRNIRCGVATILSDQRVLLLGTVQAAFEGCMYAFVFMWAPALQAADAKVPFGWVFSAFMLCLMLGSSAFQHCVRRSVPPALILRSVLLLASACMAVPLITQRYWALLAAFGVFEACCGAYFPAVSTLRGQVLPEGQRATIMNLFRLAMNALVVTVLVATDYVPRAALFGTCAAVLGVAAACQQALCAAM